jgi:beta-galactosidase
MLEAVACTADKVVARAQVKTAGAPARMVLVPDRVRIRADGEDLAFVTVRIEDASGTLVPDADNLVRFSVQGAGRVAGVDNGDPASLESFQARERKAFSGLALLIVRSNRGVSGSIRIQATSDGLTAAGASLRAE